MIVVQGRTLVGRAAAARLARLGHDVSLVGGEVPHVPDVIELPAAWRDLFKKTGRPMAGELNSIHAELVPAPPVTYLLPDGAELVLPDDRGGQYYAIREAFGETQAAQWRDTLDLFDDAWNVFRRHGLETALAPSKPEVQRALLLDRTLTEVAERAGRLAPLLLAESHFAGTDSPMAPAVLAIRQVLVRTFSRHWLFRDDQPVAGSALLELLDRRLELLGVGTSPVDAPTRIVECRPALPKSGLLGPRLRPGLAPAISESDGGEPAEIIDLTGAAPVRHIRTAARTTTYDHTQAHASLDAGIAPDSKKAWLARTTPMSSRASATSLGGPEPWAQLLTGALAAYLLHENLTGEDPSPSNKSFKMPRLRD